MFNTTKEKLPSLEEISAKPIKEIIGLAPKLSISELLMIGAVPLDFSPRPCPEQMQLGGIINEKIKQLEKAKEQVSAGIVTSIFPQFKQALKPYHITSFLDKYQFLVSEMLWLVKGRQFQKKTMKEINRFKDVLPDFGEELPHSKITDELEKLGATGTKLKYLYHDYAFGQGLAVIGQKLKTPERIASKAGYYLIMHYRDNNGGERIEKMSDLKGELNPNLIKDIAGVQIILDAPYETGLKPLVGKLKSVPGMIVCDRPGNKIEDYYVNNHGSYKAIHTPVFIDRDNSYKYKRHRFKDSVEIIIMEFDRFIEANFDPEESYWRRMGLQKIGIVSKEVHGGKLRVDKFTPFELKWKTEIERRALSILNYHKTHPQG
ncbi:MAG: hypothetical protein V1866_01370 [archaeon]